MQRGYDLAASSRFKQVSKLWIDAAELTELPAAIGQLSSLEELHIENNPIATLPDELAELPRLSKIWLGNIGIAPEMPKVIYKLEHLTSLMISNSGVSEVSDELGELTHLAKLSLRSNPGIDQPEPRVLSDLGLRKADRRPTRAHESESSEQQSDPVPEGVRSHEQTAGCKPCAQQHN